MRNPVIVIAGPTASGKTAMAVKLAKKFNGEVINADSRSIYKEMDIGTGKPTKEETEGVPHHLFDIVEPDVNFTLADYQKLAKTAIAEIQERGRIPFLVGGTGLYIDAVVYDFNLTNASFDPKIREQMEKLTDAELFAKLTELDPLTAEVIDENNRRRLIRALEVVLQTNTSFVEQKTRMQLPKNFLYLAIDVPREELYEKINKRVDVWLNQGFEDEVKHLLEKYSLDLPSMSGIGYKQFGLYLTGEISKEEAIAKFQQGDRNLAKRQITWLKRNQDIKWISNTREADRLIKEFLAKN